MKNKLRMSGSLLFALMVFMATASPLFSQSNSFTNPNSTTVSTTPTSISHPESAVVITQSNSQSITNGIACAQHPLYSRENTMHRNFNLATDFGITEAFEVTAVEFAIEAITTSGYDVAVNIYSTEPNTFPGGTLTLEGSTVYTATNADAMSIVNVPVSATIPAGQALVMELAIEDGEATGEGYLVFGTNSAGETGPSYITAPICGANTPTAMSALGLDDALVWNVISDPEGGDPDPTDGCEWTVIVYDEGPGDEVAWELRAEDGSVLLSGGGYGNDYYDEQTVVAEGPLELWVSTEGANNNNTVSGTLSNGTEILVEGTVPGGITYTFNDLNCSEIVEPGDGCEWTVIVEDDNFGDEVFWELRGSNGEILLSGGDYGSGYYDEQSIIADGPLEFWITSDGYWGDNSPNYTVSADSTVLIAGILSGGSTLTFSDLYCDSEPVPTPCDPGIMLGVEPITRVIVADIDNTSDANSTEEYEDFTHIEGHMAPGESYDIALEGNTDGPYTNHFTVWVDWDGNGRFDSYEMYEIGSIANSTGTDGQQATATIEVPADAVEGVTMMRVIKAYGSSPIDPCGQYGYGQIEDYTIIVGEDTPGTTGPEGCLDTLYAGGNNGSEGGAVYFDVVVGGEDIELSGLSLNIGDSGTSFTVDVYTLEGTYAGNEGNQGAWTLRTSGSGTSAGEGNASEADLDSSFTMSANTTYGVALVMTSAHSHYYTNGNGNNESFSDDNITINLGSASNVPFDGSAFSPRVFNGTLCYGEGGGAGSDDCGQGDDSNNFENGLNITAGGTYRNADDFIVTDGPLNVKSIELNIFAEAPVDSININFFENDGGAPGSTIVESVSGLVPYSQSVVGNNFGFNVYTVLVEVDLTFDNGTYWMQPEAVAAVAYWEVATTGTLGEPIHMSENNGAWEADEDGSQGVFKLHCEVVDPPASQCLFGIMYNVEPITRVVFSNIDNTSSPEVNGSPALEDFTNIEGNVSQGSSYEIAVEGNTDGEWTSYVTAWIDWDQNGEWDSSEMYEIGTIFNSTGTDGQQVTDMITVPANAVLGATTMRVIKAFGEYPQDPCGSYLYGQAEDYTIVVDDIVGINDNDNTGFTYYPNPAHDVLNIVSNIDIESVSAFNVLGQQVLNSKGQNSQIDVSGLPMGAYVFRVQFVNGEIETFKVLKD